MQSVRAMDRAKYNFLIICRYLNFVKIKKSLFLCFPIWSRVIFMESFLWVLLFTLFNGPRQMFWEFFFCEWIYTVPHSHPHIASVQEHNQVKYYMEGGTRSRHFRFDSKIICLYESYFIYDGKNCARSSKSNGHINEITLIQTYNFRIKSKMSGSCTSLILF
jgi:hypothetical protein